MKITLYGLTPFDRSGKVRWLLEELGVPYENHWLDRDKKEHEGEAFLRINPLGRVPCVQINERPMFESGAICSYLSDLFPEKKMSPSPSAPERLEYEQMMYLAASSIDPFVSRIMIIEDIPPGEIYQKKEAALIAEVNDVSEYLNQLLSKSEYLMGNQFSAVDVNVTYHLYFCRLWPELKAVTDQYPKLSTYLDRMQKRPAAVKADVFSYEG